MHPEPMDYIPRDVDRRVLIALIPFCIALPGVAMIAWLLFGRSLSDQMDWVSVVFGVMCGVLAFDLPVCLLVAIQWIATGEAPELSLSPLIPTREERRFHRTLRERQRLDDDEFYSVYYAESGIPKRLTVQLRASLQSELGFDLGGLHPLDNLTYADSEIDWGDIIYRINRDFKVVFPEAVITETNYTFDSFVRCLTQLELDGKKSCSTQGRKSVS
jgi:hypothetical protein